MNTDKVNEAEEILESTGYMFYESQPKKKIIVYAKVTDKGFHFKSINRSGNIVNGNLLEES